LIYDLMVGVNLKPEEQFQIKLFGGFNKC